MAHILTLGDLQKHFEEAREKLSRDRLNILIASPLPDNFSRDAYGFSYMRAERLGMEVISQCLKEVAWLPMQLDPRAEIVLENRNELKRWLSDGGAAQPDGNNFGNDFIHALTRTALAHGWHSAECRALAARIGELFHDLSCLIGLIYYGVWMSENGIEGLPITNPQDLERTAQEISTMTRSPQIAALLKRRRLDAETQAKPTTKTKKEKPVLRVVDKTDADSNTTV